MPRRTWSTRIFLSMGRADVRQMPAKSRRCPVFGQTRLDCSVAPRDLKKTKPPEAVFVVIDSRAGRSGRAPYLNLACGTVRNSPGSDAR